MAPWKRTTWNRNMLYELTVQILWIFYWKKCFQDREALNLPQTSLYQSLHFFCVCRNSATISPSSWLSCEELNCHADGRKMSYLFQHTLMISYKLHNHFPHITAAAKFKLGFPLKRLQSSNSCLPDRTRPKMSVWRRRQKGCYWYHCTQ